MNFSFRYLANRFQDFSLIWFYVFKLIESPIGKIIIKATEKEANTISYATLAIRMENKLIILEIAAANEKNKLLIVVACHRVIGSGEKLVGFSAGFWCKKLLLEHETRMTILGQSFLDYKF